MTPNEIIKERDEQLKESRREALRLRGQLEDIKDALFSECDRVAIRTAIGDNYGDLKNGLQCMESLLGIIKAGGLEADYDLHKRRKEDERRTQG